MSVCALAILRLMNQARVLLESNLCSTNFSLIPHAPLAFIEKAKAVIIRRLSQIQDPD